MASKIYGGDDKGPVGIKTEGIHIVDKQGKKYIDLSSGTFDQPLGYDNPVLKKAIIEQANDMTYLPGPFISEKILNLAEELVKLAPDNIKSVHLRDLTGSTAIEGAVKIAQTATKKRDIFSFFGSHHGQTFFTTDLSGNAFRGELYPVHFSGIIHIPAPYCYRCFYKQKFPECNFVCINRIREHIEYASSGNVACIVCEPILGNGGNIVPPKGYFRELKKLCKEFEILLVFDEVQTGLGRTGYMFAAEYFEVEPDIIVLGKGLGGPTPRSAILISGDIPEYMPSYQHSTTGRSNQISLAVALATLKELQKPFFLQNVIQVGEVLGTGLKKLKDKFSFIGDVRGLGFMWGVEIVNPADERTPDVVLNNRIIKKAFTAGLIIRSSRYGYGNVFKVRPALILTEDDAKEIIEKLDRVLEKINEDL